MTIHLDRTRHRPWGVLGGGPARGSAAVVIQDGTERRLPAKCTVTLPRGAVVAIRTAGGGGWGAPEQRADDRVRHDTREGLLPDGRRDGPDD